MALEPLLRSMGAQQSEEVSVSISYRIGIDRRLFGSAPAGHQLEIPCGRGA